MWLDRLAGAQANVSGTSTPRSTSRSYSPLPRRTSSNLSPYVTSQQAGQSARSSSLSLVSNDSTTSLLASSRKPNGSGLRQTSTVYDGPDSLDILDKLLSAGTDSDDTPNQHGSSIKEEDFELEPDFGGLSLKELAELEPPEDDVVPGPTPRSQTAEDCKKHPIPMEEP